MRGFSGLVLALATCFDGVRSLLQTLGVWLMESGGLKSSSRVTQGRRRPPCERPDGGALGPLAWSNLGAEPHVDWGPGAEWVIGERRIAWLQGDEAVFSPSADATNRNSTAAAETIP